MFLLSLSFFTLPVVFQNVPLRLMGYEPSPPLPVIPPLPLLEEETTPAAEPGARAIEKEVGV